MKPYRNIVLSLLVPAMVLPVYAVDDGKHEGHAQKRHVELDQQVLEEFGIQLAVADSGVIVQTLTMPGEIVYNPDSLIHIVPRVSGITREVYHTLGDEVQTGELLATLASRELAELRAELDAARSRYRLARVTFERERTLKDEGLTSEREYLDAQQLRDDARIEFDLAREKLRAIGLAGSDPNMCKGECDSALYEIRSPGDGVIIEKHIVRGELLNETSRPFVIADLDQVWIHLTVYQKDLGLIKTGQKVRIVSGFGIPDMQSEIVYISPEVSEETRSATARVVIDNTERLWRPGLFVSAEVRLSESAADIIVPRTALQTIDDQTVVFVRHGNELITRPVQTGRADQHNIEILDGLNEGDTYVADNAFVLKSQLQKGTFGHGHAH